MSLAASTAVWERSTLYGTSRLVLLAIAERADDHGVAWPSVASLAERTGLKRRRVQQIIAEAVESGELSIARGGGRSNTSRYTITLLNDAAHFTETAPPETVQPVAQRVHSETQRVQPMTINGAAECTRTVKNPLEPKAVLRLKPQTTRRPDVLWDTLVEIIGSAAAGVERGKWNKALKSMRESGATPDTLRQVADAYRRHPTFADCLLTPMALAANWTVLLGASMNGNGHHTVTETPEQFRSRIAAIDQRWKETP